MNRLLDEREDELTSPKDREISLGTTMLLGIFFALALLCAVFFGFGYSLGVRHAAAGVAPPAAPEPSPALSVGGAKPSPGSPMGQPGKPAASVSVPYTAPESAPPAKTKPAAATDADFEAAAPVVRTPAPASPVVPATALPAGSFMVQVAAVSHQEDADLLVSTLKRRGYNVAIHQEQQDKLLHVQVGPFGVRKEAEAMRQKLLSDGFNAIVK